MRAAVLSANLGGYDAPRPWPELIVPDGVTLEVHRFTDANFPPRTLAMTSRLQCSIPKWFGVDFAPDADVVIWIDASCAPTPQAVGWFLEELGDASIAVFRHPERQTVREEYEFMVKRMARPGEQYLNSRYRGEWLDDMFAHLEREQLGDLPLYASTAFVYRPTSNVIEALRETFLWKVRYLLHDQFAFPYALHRHGCAVRVIPDNYLKCEALTFVRGRTKH